MSKNSDAYRNSSTRTQDPDIYRGAVAAIERVDRASEDIERTGETDVELDEFDSIILDNLRGGE
jgi:hypothetical protein